MNGLLETWGCTAYLQMRERVLMIRTRSDQPSMLPEIEVGDGWLVYNPPPMALADHELSLDVTSMPLTELVPQIVAKSRVPIEIIGAETADLPTIDLKVEDMKLRFVVDYITRLTETKAVYLDDRIRIEVPVRPAPPPQPAPGPEHGLPTPTGHF